MIRRHTNAGLWRNKNGFLEKWANLANAEITLMEDIDYDIQIKDAMCIALMKDLRNICVVV